MNKRKNFQIIFVLGWLSAIGPFSIDMYLPGFPAIAKELNTDIAHVSLSLSSFFIGISVGQIVYGPLVDRFGRKRPMYVGLILYILTSIGCAFGNSADALMVLRFLQALGACVGMVASRAMVRDLFSVTETAKVFSLLMLIVGVSPIIAPTLGGYVTAVLGWRYVFVVLTLISACILTGVYFFLPESRLPDPNYSLKPKVIFGNFRDVVRDSQFVTYAFTGALATSGLYAYIAGSPAVFMKIYGVTDKQYGWIFALIALGLIISSQLNSLLLRTFKSEQIIRIALLAQSTTGILLFVGTVTGECDLFSTIFLIFVFLCCQGFTFPNSSALSLAPFSRNAGSASALMGAIQMGVGTLSSALVNVFANGTALPMTGIMACCAIGSFSVLMTGRRIIRIRATEAVVNEETKDMISKL